MTWTSPDTGVADRTDAARLVQRGLPLNCTVSLCPATSPARTRAGSNAGYHIAYAISNARSRHVSRVIALVPGSLGTAHRRRSEAHLRYCNGGPHMFQIHYELASSQRYQQGPGETAHPLAWAGYRTQSIRDGTAMPGAPPYAATRLRTGPHSLTPMSYSGMGRGAPERGQSGSRATPCPPPGVARTDEIPAPAPWPARREGGRAGRTGHRRCAMDTTAQGQPSGERPGPRPGPPGRPALPHETHQHTAFTPNRDKCVQPGLILYFPSKEHY